MNKVVRAAIIGGILAVLYITVAIYSMPGGFGSINATYVGSTITYTSGMPTDSCYNNISSYTGSNRHVTIIYPICVEQTTSYKTIGSGYVPDYTAVVALTVFVFAGYFIFSFLALSGRRRKDVT